MEGNPRVLSADCVPGRGTYASILTVLRQLLFWMCYIFPRDSIIPISHIRNLKFIRKPVISLKMC